MSQRAIWATNNHKSTDDVLEGTNTGWTVARLNNNQKSGQTVCLCVSKNQMEKHFFFKDEQHSPRAAASPVSPAAPQSTWRWPGLSGTCPDSLWRAPPAGAEWIPAHHQPGAEQCLGNTLRWCRAADPPSGLSPGKHPRWKTSFKTVTAVSY